MDNSTIKEFLDKIGENKSYRGVLLDDYPSPNHAAQMIAERVQAIVFSLENFRGYVDENNLNNLINDIWSLDVNKGGNKLVEGFNKHIIDFNNKKECKNNNIDSVIANIGLNVEYDDLKKVIKESFELFNLIKSVKGVDIAGDSCSLRQLYDWFSLITHNVTFEPKEIGHPKWTDLSNKLMDITKADDNCCLITLIISLVAVFGILIVCNIKAILEIDLTDLTKNYKWLNYIFIFVSILSILTTIVLLLCKFLKYQTKQCDVDMKLKEKMMNVVVDAFNEDREFSRQRTKVEIALHDKLEKARIEEWIKNKENERKLNIMEQERIAELNNVLLELAKVKNTVTLSDPNGSGKTITIERSVLSDDCCNELKGIIDGFVKTSNSTTCNAPVIGNCPYLIHIRSEQATRRGMCRIRCTRSCCRWR